LHFEVRWPDGSHERYYSPSTIIRAHLSAGQRYSISEFVAHARDALTLASERVRAKFGYACSSALDTLQQIEERAQGFPELGDEVQVVAILGPPLTASDADAALTQ
jgi:uncharacterized repeat protein (TIGR04042 family)